MDDFTSVGLIESAWLIEYGNLVRYYRKHLQLKP